MAKEPRPKGYPKHKNYKPSQFMLPTSHYDKKKADRAVTFIENLCHTKGKWAGTPFWLLPWQEQLIRDIFGIVKPDGNRQFRTAFVEICKKVGKSELAAAIALYLLYADNEPSAEVYGAAADRQQASIVFDVAKQMVEMSPALMKRSKLMGATKRIVNYGNAGYYQVLSAEVGGKHGFSVSGLVFDEIHTQPNRQLYDVLTKGSSDARQNPADEITFKWLRCNMWVSSTVAWIPEETIPRRVKANYVPYDIWEKQGYIMSTEGNVIHYDFIEKFIMDLSEKYHIIEIAVDRWNATHVIQNLEDNGLTMVPFGQGFASMSAPTKEFYRLLMEGKIIHGGHPVMRWMAGNVVVDTDPAGNIKVTKAKSKEKIDGIVAAIMALDRAVRHESEGRSVYDTRGIILI